LEPSSAAALFGRCTTTSGPALAVGGLLTSGKPM